MIVSASQSTATAGHGLHVSRGIAAGIGLFFFLRGWNMAFDLLASVFALAVSIDFKFLLINTVPLILLIPTIAAATAIYFLGRPELSKRW